MEVSRHGSRSIYWARVGDEAVKLAKPSWRSLCWNFSTGGISYQIRTPVVASFYATLYSENQHLASAWVDVRHALRRDYFVRNNALTYTVRKQRGSGLREQHVVSRDGEDVGVIRRAVIHDAATSSLTVDVDPAVELFLCWFLTHYWATTPMSL